jgi:hypothetical protein
MATQFSPKEPFLTDVKTLRERAAAYEAQGVAEIVYAPIGPDVPGELRAMREALG